MRKDRSSWNAGVADWVREQPFDTESGTGCWLVRTTSGGKDCLLWTIPTHKGLDYVVSTGRTLDGLKKTGTYKGTNDNLSLPLILEPGTASGFLSVDVTWGLEYRPRRIVMARQHIETEAADSSVHAMFSNNGPGHYE